MYSGDIVDLSPQHQRYLKTLIFRESSLKKTETEDRSSPPSMYAIGLSKRRLLCLVTPFPASIATTSRMLLIVKLLLHDVHFCIYCHPRTPNELNDKSLHPYLLLRVGDEGYLGGVHLNVPLDDTLFIPLKA